MRLSTMFVWAVLALTANAFADAPAAQGECLDDVQHGRQRDSQRRDRHEQQRFDGLGEHQSCSGRCGRRFGNERDALQTRRCAQGQARRSRHGDER